MKSWLSRLFAGAMVALALTSSAGATQKTIAQLTAEITSLFADNTSGAITPAKLRQVAQDTVDSYFNSLANVTGNTVLAGQAGGASGAATFRALVGADLPVPSLTTLGGIKASSAVSNQFMTSVSVAGAPVTAQPAFSNISGLLSTTQSSGSLDALTTCGTWGNVLFRGTAGWVCLAPGGAGTFLKSNGSGADVAWATPAGSGTVTSVGCGTGLTCAPSPIVGAGTVTLATPVTVANGGIGVGTLTANGVVLGNGTSALTVATIGTGGRLLIDQGAGTPPAFVAASQDCTVSASGVHTCTKTNNVAFGTAATLNVGTGASQIVQLNGSSQLPAVDGSLLTNLASGGVSSAGGRCTLTTATPILTSTVTGATSIFYSPYISQFVPIYNGTTMSMVDVAGELTNILANSATGNAGPAAAANNSNYDLFVWSNSGTPTFTRGPLWTSDTARGSGAGTTEIVRVKGVWLNANAITNGPAAQRGTYVCTVRSNGTATVDYQFGANAVNGTAGIIGVWNLFNRVNISMFVQDNTNTWSNASTTIVAANASNTMRVSFISGLAEDGISAVYKSLATAGTVGRGAMIGIGLNSTSAIATGSTSDISLVAVINTNVPLTATYQNNGALGFNFLQALESSPAATGVTFIGDNGAPTTTQTGLTFNFRG